MIYLFRYFSILFLLCNCPVYAQNNIRKLWNDADPIKPNSAILSAEKIQVHTDYLKQAVAKHDLSREFYGNVYLYTDNMDEQNYPAAILFLLAAENIAHQSNNINWQGFVKLKTGWVAVTVHNDIKTAIKEFKAGADLSIQANDSVCMAQCFEMLSTMYNGLKKFDSSQYYFNLAMPVLRKSADINLDAAYSNFCGFLLNQGRFAEALLYIDSSIQIVQIQKNKRKENFYLINRAVILTSMKLYDSSEAILKNCMATDAENKWMDNLMYDYEGLNETYQAQGNYTRAYGYLKKYHVLKDSLAGVSVNLKVAGIIATHRRELERSAAKNTLQKRNWIILTTGLLLVVALLFWRIQYARNRKEHIKNKNSLAELTRILIEKNTQLAALEGEVNILHKKITPHSIKESAAAEEVVNATEKQADFETTLYNQRILTADDWAAFKIYFDKAYPGYLLRLRNACPALTEAEERMFLFIKLKLTNKEAAAILGISADSVKKTRTRLRKRITPDENIDLDEYVKNF